MQIPTRRKETYVKPKPDPYLTEAKFEELKNKLATMKRRHPALCQEVKHLAEMGDFSENAGYQLAKGRLRSLNSRIAELEIQLRDAIVFRPDQDGRIGLGSRVTVETETGARKDYTILGSVETDPSSGVISHNSPLGAALLGHRAGETAELDLGGRKKLFRILSVN